MLRHFALIILAAALLLASAASPASAHTKLLRSAPADGANVGSPPNKVTLTFSTDISGKLQEVEIVNADGEEISGKADVSGPVATVPLEGAGPGQVSVAWRTLGADGHPISGNFVFTVSPSPRADVPTSETLESQAVTPSAGADADRSQPSATAEYPRATIERVASVSRFVYYLSLLVVAGSGVFAAAIARRWRPRYFRRSCLLLLASSIAMFLTNLALAGEYSIWGVLNPWNIVPHIATPHGRVAAASAVLALLLLRSYRTLKAGAKAEDDRGRGTMVALSIALACTPAFGGHAIASQEPWLRVPADMLHLLAASIWLGGIVQLQGVASASNAAHPAVYPTVTRFARLAFASVVTIVVTGATAAWLEIGLDAGELFGSTYGRLVLLKVLLLGFTIPLAKANQRRHLPALEGGARRASANLRRYVVFELLLVVAVVAVTSWLVYETPPRHSNMGHDLRAQSSRR